MWRHFVVVERPSQGHRRGSVDLYSPLQLSSELAPKQNSTKQRSKFYFKQSEKRVRKPMKKTNMHHMHFVNQQKGEGVVKTPKNIRITTPGEKMG